MYISLQQLEQKPVRFKVELPASEIEFDSSVTQDSLLRAEGSAELLSSTLEEIRMVGKLDVTITTVCDRCLEATVFAIQKSFDLVYVPNVAASGAGEVEVSADAIEVGYYEGNGIELNDVLREVVLLELPMQLTCGEDCKGICPICGQNRNQSHCSCQLKKEDDRWSGLRNFKPLARTSN